VPSPLAHYRTERQLRVTSVLVVFVEVGYLLGLELYECFPPFDGECLAMLLRDDEPPFLVNLLAEQDRRTF
jgi:hypothetical protein